MKRIWMMIILLLVIAVSLLVLSANNMLKANAELEKVIELLTKGETQ